MNKNFLTCLLTGLLVSLAGVASAQLSAALVQQKICTKWSFDRAVIHESGVPVESPQGDQANTLVFQKDGTYLQTANGNVMEGTWEFNEEASRLFLKVLRYNGRDIPQGEARTYQWILVKLDQGKMELVREARQNLIREIYRTQ
ncbi:MAG: hypothetical protein H6585_11100 [Flavobacteriales bacterium]|nr:hypothetical protein [Flavobacteriales bacterium]MCB9448881.1 hypothetical protein [Flavobacteriales bacterium]